MRRLPDRGRVDHDHRVSFTWDGRTVEGLRGDTLASALNTLTSIRFSDTSDPADAKVAEAKPHARAYTLTAFDGKTVTISLARKPEEKKMKPPVADKSLLGAATPPSPTAGTPAPDPKL